MANIVYVLHLENPLNYLILRKTQLNINVSLCVLKTLITLPYCLLALHFPGHEHLLVVKK